MPNQTSHSNPQKQLIQINIFIWNGCNSMQSDKKNESDLAKVKVNLT